LFGSFFIFCSILHFLFDKNRDITYKFKYFSTLFNCILNKSVGEKAMKKCFIYMTLCIAVCALSGPAVSARGQEIDNNTLKETLRITDNTVSLPLQSVLVLALKNNLDITFEKLSPEFAQTEVTKEEGAYDFLFSSQFTKSRENTQVGNALAGSGSSADMFNENFNFDATLQKKFTPGTQAELKLSNQEYQSNLSFMGLNPEYSANLVLSLQQPLLRDFGIEIGKSLIKIASLKLESSENYLRKRVMDILFQVESLYWDLSYRIHDLKSKEKSLRRAEDLLREFKIRIDAGTLAPIEIHQAEAEVALRRQDVIVAESAVTAGEDNLKAALNLYEDETYWNIAIVPSDTPYSSKTAPDLAACIQTAFKERPDFRQAKLDLQAAHIQVKYSKNQTLPRIDLIGSIGTSGLGGRPQDTSGAFGAFFFAEPSPWDGHWDRVYDGIADDDYYSYSIGIKIEFPLQNRIAKSYHAKAKVQASQSVTNLKNAENLIINDVRDAIRNVETSMKVIDSAMASMKLAQEKLKAEEKKYKVGMSTAHDVLEFQEDLAKAESTLAYAQAEHSKSLANLARAQGVLLQVKGLSL